MTAGEMACPSASPDRHPAPSERCRGKTDISISPQEFGLPGPSQLGTGTETGASAMHHSKLEQGEVGGRGGISPLLSCTPSWGPGAAQRVCEYPQGTVTDSASSKHSPLQTLTAENSQLMTGSDTPCAIEGQWEFLRISVGRKF